MNLSERQFFNNGYYIQIEKSDKKSLFQGGRVRGNYFPLSFLLDCVQIMVYIYT